MKYLQQIKRNIPISYKTVLCKQKGKKEFGQNIIKK